MGKLIKTDSGEVLLSGVKWCESFGCKFRGLMLRRELAPQEGLLMVEARESKVQTTIHMLFMLMPVAVVWLDEGMRVVDKIHAKPWRLAYAPQAPARYVLEAHPDLLDEVKIGDILAFEAD